MDEKMMMEMMGIMKQHTAALQQNTAAIQEQTEATNKQTAAIDKLEHTIHILFEDNHGYITGGVDAKLDKLKRIADQFTKAAAAMDEASHRIPGNNKSNRY